MDIVPKSAWQRQASESVVEYGWFTVYLELGDDRTLPKTARRAGVPIRKIEEAASSFNWSHRCYEWREDSAKIVKDQVRDEETVHSVEWQAGQALIRLALQGFDGKNPHLMDGKGLTAMLKEGIELTRKGSGAADMVVEINDRRQIGQQFAEFLGEEWEDVDAAEE